MHADGFPINDRWMLPTTFSHSRIVPPRPLLNVLGSPRTKRKSTAGKPNTVNPVLLPMVSLLMTLQVTPRPTVMMIFLQRTMTIALDDSIESR